MGFNRRKMEDQRRDAAEKEAASRRATDAQVLEDAERLIAAWNERQALRAPMIFSPTIGTAVRAGYWFLWVCCPACRTINAIDLRTLDRHPDAAVPHCHAAHAGRTRRSPNSYGYRGPASWTRCARSIDVACWANDIARGLFLDRPGRREAAGHVRSARVVLITIWSPTCS